MFLRFSLPALTLVCIVADLGGQAQTADAPLPERGAFLAEVRKHLRSDDALQSQYTFHATVRQRRLDGHGRVTKEETEVSEVYPSEDPEYTYRRVIERDGAPVKPAELEKKDREHRQRVLEYAERLQREEGRAKRLQKKAERERREQVFIDELFREFEFTLTGRDTIDGQRVIVVAWAPRRGATLRTRQGRIIGKFKGRAWVSESEHEVVKVDAEAIEDVTWGLGLLARMHKGSRAEFQRRKVNGEVWLPAEARFFASARIALVKRLRVEGSVGFSNYRKITAATTTTFLLPKLPNN